MHNLALALQAAGHLVSGSDDEIYEPARGRLAAAGLLPKEGWDEHRISLDIELVILGMHARADNPELLRAQDLGLRVVSYPEFLYEHSADKLRIAIAGSHGKTTTTSLVMHILRHNEIDFDYAVGAAVEGFGTMVRLSDAPIMVIEADEYLSSPIDRRSKFLHYRPQIAVVTGIAHDHFNVFPTLAEYVQPFEEFAGTVQAGGQFIYYKETAHVWGLLARLAPSVQTTAYVEPAHHLRGGKTYLLDWRGREVGLSIFGAHNLQNLQAARLVCRELGLSDAQIFGALPSFRGAARRLQCLRADAELIIFSDFAHAPSKVRATVAAVRAQYPERQLLAALELHTFSSLNAAFLPQYAESLSGADAAFLHFNPQTLAQKRLPNLTTAQLREAFAMPDLAVFESAEALHGAISAVLAEKKGPSVLLLMSSGHWGGFNMLNY